MTQSMHVMILAAGYGRRIGANTASPKPLIRINHHYLIEHHLIALQKAGFQNIVINVSAHCQKIQDILGNGAQYGLNIIYSYEHPTPLGTGGGIYNALPLLDHQPFLVISADIWTDYPFHTLRTHNLATQDLVHLVLVNNPAFHPQGDFHLAQGRLCTNTTAPKYTFANIGIYHPDLFQHFTPAPAGNRTPIAPLLQEAIRQQRATGEHYTGQWSNINTATQLTEAQRCT